MSDAVDDYLSELTNDEFVQWLRQTDQAMTPLAVIEIERRGPEMLDSEPALLERWEAKNEKMALVFKSISSITDAIKPLSDWTTPLAWTNHVPPVERFSLDIPTLDVDFHVDPSHGVRDAIRDLHTVMEQTIKPLQDTADAQAVQVEQFEHAQKTGQRVAVMSIGIALASVAIAVVALLVNNG